MRRILILSVLVGILFGQSLSITTATLPDAWAYCTYGTAPTFNGVTLVATGGQTPYTWSVQSGVLPNGISLSTGGVLSGAATLGGIYTFTVRVTDALSATASQALTLNVKGPAVTISGAVVMSGSVVLR